MHFVGRNCDALDARLQRNPNGAAATMPVRVTAGKTGSKRERSPRSAHSREDGKVLAATRGPPMSRGVFLAGTAGVEKAGKPIFSATDVKT